MNFATDLPAIHVRNFVNSNATSKWKNVCLHKLEKQFSLFCETYTFVGGNKGPQKQSIREKPVQLFKLCSTKHSHDADIIKG
jgi:hypothetical protein